MPFNLLQMNGTIEFYLLINLLQMNFIINFRLPLWAFLNESIVGNSGKTG
jgi:hypothetical protein